MIPQQTPGFGYVTTTELGHEIRKLREANGALLTALEAIRGGYQQLFDVMPVAWQTYDDIAAGAISQATGCAVLAPTPIWGRMKRALYSLAAGAVAGAILAIAIMAGIYLVITYAGF